MNQLKTNKIGFSNELPNELQNENDCINTLINIILFQHFPNLSSKH